MTATGENGNIAISGSNLPPGQYGVCYMGLRNPFDLYTTQGLQGPNFFGLEDVSESGELPPILDVVSIATASPQDWITAVLERVVDVQVNPRFHADRIVEAIAIIPASSFLH